MPAQAGIHRAGKLDMIEAASSPIATATADIGTTRYAVSLRTGNHTLVGDEPKPEGADAGPSPFGLVLAGLGACTAITLRMYAERKSWPLEAVHVALAFRWEGEGTVRHGHIERELRLEGTLDATQRTRCAEIAEKTPVTRALKAGIRIDTTLR
jgi:putative redox protein